ncbi:MAG: sigma-54 dependent transcriptional regulator [Saprospiraceae bacterium]|nr:sigma-54 dependent transcriptional regulator [Saprospiraceae bacterium]
MLPKIFIVEDDLIFARIIQKSLENEDYDIEVFNNGKDVLDNLHKNPDIISLDYNLPDMLGTEIQKKIIAYSSDISIIILSGQEDLNVVVEAYKLGAKSYIIKNNNALVELKNAINNVAEKIKLKNEVEQLKDELIDRNKYSSIIGESPEILKILKLIQKVEKTNILTMITGESGTGKEVVAKAIHYNSDRKRKPFVAVNVAAIPPDLIEDELFGHEKGAFTGASSKRKGKFEEAHTGTIFLDEIGEMELNLQTKLLRVLQESQISRLGSNKVINIDVRVIAATNKNLGQRVKEGKFREDLYYRIQGFLIHLPPLKNRGNDIILLANHFLKSCIKSNKLPEKTFDASAIKSLLEHNWSGNVRELISVVERATLISNTNIITSSDLIYSESILS